jgi:hypothetical protein
MVPNMPTPRARILAAAQGKRGATDRCSLRELVSLEGCGWKKPGQRWARDEDKRRAGLPRQVRPARLRGELSRTFSA